MNEITMFQISLKHSFYYTCQLIVSVKFTGRRGNYRLSLVGLRGGLYPAVYLQCEDADKFADTKIEPIVWNNLNYKRNIITQPKRYWNRGYILYSLCIPLITETAVNTFIPLAHSQLAISVKNITYLLLLMPQLTLSGLSCTLLGA